MDDKSKNVKILGIILAESDFKRIPKIQIDGKEKTEVKIQIGMSIDNKANNLISEVTANISQTYEAVIQVQAKIKMVGIFNQSDLSVEEKQNFLRINAPAIVFPFVREHLMSLTVKAGLPVIIINPVNFVELTKDLPILQQ